MVEFSDGSVKAQLGPTDMRIPIQYALSYPERWETPCARVDYAALGELTFEPVDEGAFGCLRLAREEPSPVSSTPQTRSPTMPSVREAAASST